MIAQTSCRCGKELLSKLHLWDVHARVLVRYSTSLSISPNQTWSISKINSKHFKTSNESPTQNQRLKQHIQFSPQWIRSHVRSLNLSGAWPTGPMPLWVMTVPKGRKRVWGRGKAAGSGNLSHLDKVQSMWQSKLPFKIFLLSRRGLLSICIQSIPISKYIYDIKIVDSWRYVKNTMSHPWKMAWAVSIFMTLTAVHTQRKKTKRIFSLVFATAKAGSVQNGHQQTSWKWAPSIVKHDCISTKNFKLHCWVCVE